MASMRHISVSPLPSPSRFPLSASFFRVLLRSAACFVLFLWKPNSFSRTPAFAGGLPTIRRGTRAMHAPLLACLLTGYRLAFWPSVGAPI